MYKSVCIQSQNYLTFSQSVDFTYSGLSFQLMELTVMKELCSAIVQQEKGEAPGLILSLLGK